MTAGRQRLGARGELLAARWYRDQGYAVVSTNWRCSSGELDLVLRRGSVLVFAEVKTRSSHRFGHPFEAITPSKQVRIRRLAAMFMRECDERAPTVRFDAVAVVGNEVEVAEAAF